MLVVIKHVLTIVKDAHKKRVRADLSYEDVTCLKSELEVNHKELKEIAKRTLFSRKTTLQLQDLFPPTEVFSNMKAVVQSLLLFFLTCMCVNVISIQEGKTTFYGTNYRARDDLYLMMYEPEIVVRFLCGSTSHPLSLSSIWLCLLRLFLCIRI